MMDLVYCVFEDFVEGRGGGWVRSLKRPELISNTLLNLLTFGYLSEKVFFFSF